MVCMVLYINSYIGSGSCISEVVDESPGLPPTPRVTLDSPLGISGSRAPCLGNVEGMKRRNHVIQSRYFTGHKE